MNLDRDKEHNMIDQRNRAWRAVEHHSDTSCVVALTDTPRVASWYSALNAAEEQANVVGYHTAHTLYFSMKEAP